MTEVLSGTPVRILCWVLLGVLASPILAEETRLGTYIAGSIAYRSRISELDEQLPSRAQIPSQPGKSQNSNTIQSALPIQSRIRSPACLHGSGVPEGHRPSNNSKNWEKHVGLGEGKKNDSFDPDSAQEFRRISLNSISEESTYASNWNNSRYHSGNFSVTLDVTIYQLFLFHVPRCWDVHESHPRI